MFERSEIRRWRRTVWRIFERQGFTGPQISAAMVLAGVEAIGTHVESLSELTGLSPDYVKRILRRLRKYGVVRGQRLRVAWDGKAGSIAVMLDAGVAAGEFTRPKDEKRSAAQKARAASTRSRGPRRRVAPHVVGPYRPAHQKSNPLYGLPEWEKK